MSNWAVLRDNETTELYHHGIKGQKWGVRNGPPYPLKVNDEKHITPIKNYKGQLYFVSDRNIDGQTLTPRVPNNYFTKHRFENNKHKRVSFSTSVQGCLKGLSQNLANKDLFLYTPQKVPNTIYKPSKIAVPDAEITGELWVTEPVKLRMVNRLHVDSDDGAKGEQFTYGDGNVAELYGWNYRLIDE